MRITVVLDGTSALLMHNPQMADPNFEPTRRIKELTGKRKKTDEDLRLIERLEWYGGLYAENGLIVQPTSKVRKCIINAGKISKQGKMVERALSFGSLNVPLTHDGPREIDAVFADRRFHSRLSVGVQGKRVMRTRPAFPTWALRLEGLFIEDAGLNFEELQRIVALAGLSEGIGDNRVNGYGRFTGTVEASV